MLSETGQRDWSAVGGVTTSDEARSHHSPIVGYSLPLPDGFAFSAAAYLQSQEASIQTHPPPPHHHHR